jgi:hypothetical protein
MLDVAESVEVDADSNVDVDLDGDVEIQHSTLQHDRLSAFSRIRDTFESTDGRFGRGGSGWGWAGLEMWRCTSSTRPPGGTSISRVTSHTGGRLFSCADTF